MNKQPGQVTVTVETGYCPFCFRVRNLRHEERHLGTLLRTTITCESCHRTLSSTMGVAGDEPAAALVGEDSAVAAEQPAAPEEASAPKAVAKPAAEAPAKPKAKASATKAQAPKSRSPRSM